ILANLLRFVKRFLLRKSEALYAVSSESLFILPHIFFPVKTEFILLPHTFSRLSFSCRKSSLQIRGYPAIPMLSGRKKGFLSER
ncbi:hypothetical protein, partial [uncultured Megasphaera sp.]|uniref:hypothetical protein n=1 Tax=uncultured Megasphaera sp. TaxID=165188 RepID=UPI00259822A1